MNVQAADAGSAHHIGNEERISSLAASIMDSNILGQQARERSYIRPWCSLSLPVT